MQKLSSLPKDVLVKVPDDLPVPKDDGACNHLIGRPIPSVELSSTSGKKVNLASRNGWVVLYCYPMTGRSGRSIPDGWAAIPGAAGCTPQSCSFRDSYEEMTSLGAAVFGISAQTSEDQIEASQRLRLPYELLSDATFSFVQPLGLPVFEVGGMRLLKRVTLIAKAGRIEKYFYPVFPPDRNASEVLDWLRVHAV
jgi:peroxiredoxin